ncbi:MAG: hypothetical protein WC819_06225 [Parcubacteria group bacterium]|jgi:hypothetical protein
MVINEEPSLTKRLGVEARKMFLASLHNIRSCTKKYTYFVLTGMAIMIAGGFYAFDTASSHEEKPVVDQETQRYTACVFGKDVINGDEKNVTGFANIDDQCQQLSKEGYIFEPEEDEWFEQELVTMLADHPMKAMAASIAKQDKTVAGLIVGIARQESQWGMYAPSKGGVDCYNYWGYKSTGTRGQAMGYACFGSPEEAVDTIATRLNHFVYDTKRDTPAKMVTPWKCGDSCASHSPESVQRWVGTVNTYFNQIVAMEHTEEENRSPQIKLLSLKK